MNRNHRAYLFSCVVAASAVLATPARAQHPNVERGRTTSGTVSMLGLDTINGFNGNMTLQIPLGPTYPVGGALEAYGVNLTYNSNVWSHVSNGDTCPSTDPDGPPGTQVTNVFAYAHPLSNAGLGFSVSFGYLGNIGVAGAFDPVPYVGVTTYHSADGAEHPLFASPDARFLVTRDGSYLRYDTQLRLLEAPDGTMTTFNAAGRPLTVRDRFGNGLSIDYPEFFPAPANTIPKVWTVSDGYRVHRIYFRLTGFSDAREQQAVVDRVEMAAFGNQTATYTFLYNGEDSQGGGHQDLRMTGFGTQIRGCHTPSWNPHVYVLTELVLPDGTSYRAPVDRYVQGGYQGPLHRLEFPTGGATEWDYTLIPMPSPKPDVGLGAFVPVWSSSVSVSRRRLYAAGNRLEGEWLYGGAPDVDNRVNEVVRQVTYPPSDSQSTGVRVVTYFSACVYTSCVNESGVADTFAADFGLPFSRRRTPDSNGRFLSQEIFPAGSNTPIRRIYVRYENDDGDEHPPYSTFGFATNRNAREKSSHIVYLDDAIGPRGATHSASSYLDRDDFDGFGHYRKLAMSDDFGYNTNRVELTGWNQDSDGHVLAPPGSADPWIVNTYGFKQQTEGSDTARQEFTFDRATGVVSCQRKLKGRARGAFDVVAVFARDNAAWPGQVTTERLYGGDFQRVSNAPDCAGLPQAPAYELHHEYSAGVRSRTYAVVAADGSSTVLNQLDETVDTNTGRPIATRDAAGRTSSFSYDLMGRLEQSTPAGGAPSSTTFSNSATVVTTVIGSSGSPLHWARETLDGLGRTQLTEVSRPQSRSVGELRSYDALGHQIYRSELAATPGSASGSHYSGYDAFDRPALVEAADGSITTFEYTGAHIRKTTKRVWDGTAERLATTREEFDSLGRLRQIKEPTGVWTRYSYDVGGGVATVVSNSGTANSQGRSFQYDGRGFLIRANEPESGISVYRYDAKGLERSRSNGSRTLLSVYDAAGRLTQVSSPQYVLREIHYGTANAGAGKVDFSRAFNDRVVDNSCQRFEVRHDFSYNVAHGRLETEQTTVLQQGNPGSVLQWTQGYAYDGNGALTHTIYPSCLVGCSAAPRSQATVFDAGLATSAEGFATADYNDNGTVHSVTHSNGVVFTQSPDGSGIRRPGAFEASRQGTALWPREAFLYDGAGDVKKLGEKLFTYDKNARLRSAYYPGAATSRFQQYTYDEFGNLTRYGRGPTNGVVSEEIRYDADTATNRILGANYDTSGNLSSYQGWGYTWDAVQKLSTVTSGSESWTHVYDADGELIWSWRTLPSSPRVDLFSIRGLGGNLLTRFTKTTTSGAPSVTWQDYAYLDGRLVGTVNSSGQATHLDVDHSGSVRLETTPQGAVQAFHDYWPYGEEVSTSSSTETLRFHGYERMLGVLNSNADDLDYAHARYYSPTLARFLSPDPMPGRPDTPASWNRYAFVLGNPLRFTDPTGEYTFDCDVKKFDCAALKDLFEKALDADRHDTNAKVKAAAEAFGAIDVSNGVTVHVQETSNAGAAADTGGRTGPLNEGQLGQYEEHVSIPERSFKGSPNVPSSKQFTLLRALIAHEGSHVADFQKWGATVKWDGTKYTADESKNSSTYDSEYRAYQVTDAIYKRDSFQGGDLNWCLADCALGNNKSPGQVDRAIKNILSKSKEQGGIYGVTEKNPGPNIGSLPF